jgi:hypothetical protein
VNDSSGLLPAWRIVVGSLARYNFRNSIVSMFFVLRIQDSTTMIESSMQVWSIRSRIHKKGIYQTMKKAIEYDMTYATWLFVRIFDR